MGNARRSGAKGTKPEAAPTSPKPPPKRSTAGATRAADPTPAPRTERAKVDWDAIAPHYRAGIRSLADLGAEFGCSDAAIVKHAKKHGWSRNLKAKIQAKAEAKVSAAAVSAEVSANRTANEHTVVEANAELQYRIRMEHRADIGRTRSLFKALLGELEADGNPEGVDLIERLAEIVNGPETDEENEASKKRAQRMRELLNKVLGTPGRIDSAKRLTEMLEKLVKLERQAFGIDDQDGGEEDPLKALLGALASRSALPVVKQVPADE